MNIGKLLHMPESIFWGLNAKEFEKVLALSQRKTYFKGDTLFKKGSESSFFLVIIEGQVNIFNERENISQLGPGSIIGEMGFFFKKERNASAVCLKASEVLEFHQEKIFPFFGKKENEKFEFFFLENLIRSNAEKLISSNKWIIGVLEEKNQVISESSRQLKKAIMEFDDLRDDLEVIYENLNMLSEKLPFSDKEERKSERIKLKKEKKIHFIVDLLGEILPIKDLSESGAQLEFSKFLELEVDTIIKGQICINLEYFMDLKAKIVWKKGKTFGLEFSKMETQKKRQLNRLISMVKT